jgi:hypothetical protein
MNLGRKNLKHLLACVVLRLKLYGQYLPVSNGEYLEGKG